MSSFLPSWVSALALISPVALFSSTHITLQFSANFVLSAFKFETTAGTRIVYILSLPLQRPEYGVSPTILKTTSSCISDIIVSKSPLAIDE